MCRCDVWRIDQESSRRFLPRTYFSVRVVRKWEKRQSAVRNRWKDSPGASRGKKSRKKTVRSKKSRKKTVSGKNLRLSESAVSIYDWMSPRGYRRTMREKHRSSTRGKPPIYIAIVGVSDRSDRMRNGLDRQKTDRNASEPLVGTSYADIVNHKPFVSTLKGTNERCSTASSHFQEIIPT